jgi:predicted phage terminase large subunit-like protein
MGSYLPNKKILKLMCEASHLGFTKYFFKERETAKFIEGKHHELICKTLDRVLTGEIERLVINIPPGYTKTELAVIHFIARGLALNKRAKFIHTSYSDSLVNLNSSKTKELVCSPSYQELWPMKMKSDMKGKKEWYNEYGGGLYVAPSGGAITGFRAGRMEEGFTGAFICDDPLKADDAFSQPAKDTMNRRFPGTYRSRLAHQKVPMIVIMQRVAPDDPTAFLLNGGTGEYWHHLNLPVVIGEEQPDIYSHAIPIEHDLEPGPLWEVKHNLEQIEELKSDRFTYAAQYKQSPLSLGGNLIDLTKAGRYSQDLIRGPNDKLTLSFDTANKDGELNDNSVCLVWLSRGPLKYLVDVWCDKVKYPILKTTAKALIAKWSPNEVLIEDKASGQQLIQELQLQGIQNIIAIEPGQQSKVMRMANEVSPIDNGTVVLPDVATWLFDFEQECKNFPAGTKDRVDAMSQYLKRERTRFEVYVG